MILTVTVNAAIDKTLTVANLQLGHRHRAQQGLVMAGGKGINVARALKNLGEPVIAVRFPLSGSMVNAESVFDTWFATYTNRPLASIATASGSVPTVKGDPIMDVSDPLTGLITNPETLFELALVT